MGNFEHNQFDSNFGYRLLLSAILCPVVILIILMIGFSLASGSFVGYCLVMAVVCIAIAMVGDYLKLVPFPLIKALQDGLPELQEEALRKTLWKTFSVLPLSFAASAIWIVLFERLVGPYGGMFLLVLIGPVTQVTMIVHLGSNTISEGLSRSCKAVLFMLVVHFSISPAIPVTETTPARPQVQEYPR